MLIIIDMKNLRFVSLKISNLELKINQIKIWISIIQKYCCCSVAQTCLTLCNPIDCSILGFPIPYRLLKLAQICVHYICDVIQPSHPLMPSPPSALNLSQNQGLFQWVSSSHQVAKVLEFQLQHQSFQWIFKTDLLQNGQVGSPCSPRDSQESSPTPQLKASISRCSAFLIIQLSHPYMITGRTIALTRWTFVDKVMSLLFNMLSRLVITFLPRSCCCC